MWWLKLKGNERIEIKLTNVAWGRGSEKELDFCFPFTKYNLFNKINNPHTKHLTRFRFILFFPSLLQCVLFCLFLLAIIQQKELVGDDGLVGRR